MTDPLFASYLTDPTTPKFRHGEPIPGTCLANYIASNRAHSHLRQICVSEDPQGVSGNLIMFGHGPNDIAGAIKHSLTFPTSGTGSWRSCLTRSQCLGISMYRTLRAGSAQDLGDVKVLEQYYDIFNDIFFFGALKNLCTIRIVQKFPRESTVGRCISQFAGNRGKIPAQSACLIEIAARRVFEEPLEIGMTRSLAFDWIKHGETYPKLLDYPELGITRREVVERVKKIQPEPINGKRGEFFGRSMPGLYAGLDSEEDAGNCSLKDEDKDYEPDEDSSS